MGLKKDCGSDSDLIVTTPDGNRAQGGKTFFCYWSAEFFIPPFIQSFINSKLVAPRQTVWRR